MRYKKPFSGSINKCMYVTSLHWFLVTFAWTGAAFRPNPLSTVPSSIFGRTMTVIPARGIHHICTTIATVSIRPGHFSQVTFWEKDKKKKCAIMNLKNPDSDAIHWIHSEHEYNGFIFRFNHWIHSEHEYIGFIFRFNPLDLFWAWIHWIHNPFLDFSKET